MPGGDGPIPAEIESEVLLRLPVKTLKRFECADLGRRMPGGDGPIPAEIESEVLLRLPVKTLKKFECACKSWSSLISSPQFQNDHFSRAQRNPLLLTLQSDLSMFDENLVDDLILRFSVYDKDGTLVNKFSKPVPKPYFDSRVVGKPFVKSCLGLVCISAYTGPILVCNPSTQDIISLPSSQETSNVCFGFGYAPSTEEFKVVRISYGKGESREMCSHVFTLGATHWRISRPPPFHVFQGAAPFLHGALHIMPQISFQGVKDTDYIAAFDIETEEYKAIPFPSYYHSLGNCEGGDIANKSNFLRLSKLGGELCLIFDFGELDERLEVWMLKDYNNGEWVKRYNVNVSSVYPYPSYFFRAFPSDNMGDESILLNCADQQGVKLLRYNIEDGIVALMKDKEWGAVYYTESFYSLRDCR